MVKRIVDYLDADESCSLTSFLVEVLGLEDAIRIALATYYSSPEGREEFTEQFLDKMTLGTAVDRLRPVLDYIGVGEDDRRALREVVDIRNVIAHRLPTSAGEREDDDFATVRVYETRNGPVRLRDLEQYTVHAERLRVILSLPWVRESASPDAEPGGMRRRRATEA
jgi:hypothetical protein